MKYLILAIALIVGGCISPPVIYKSNPNTVMIKGMTGHGQHRAIGFDMAELECNKHGKHAVPLGETATIMAYHCEY